MRSRWIVIGVFGAALLLTMEAYQPQFMPIGEVLRQKISGKATIADRLNQYGEISRARWATSFGTAHIAYPPARLLLLALKDEKKLEIYACNSETEGWKFVTTKPIVRASGKTGPKLREGDLQVPEGFYHVESLNPNSAYHLSLRVSYPSEEDKRIADQEHRNNLGSDIMIHGGAASIGCLAMGDEVAQDLFVLAADSGIENVQIVICPLDFRVRDVPHDTMRAQWLESRYAQLRKFARTLLKPRE